MSQIRLYKILILGPNVEIPGKRLWDLIEYGPNADELDALTDLRVGETLDYSLFLDEYRITRTA